MPAPSSFTFEPLYLALAAMAAFLYVRAARRDPPGTRRAWLFGLGLITLAASLNSPLETIAIHYLLLVHLLQNVMIGDWAPLLLILGMTSAMRAAVDRAGGRPWAVLTRGRVALPVWIVGWYAVHAALFYDWALRHPLALNLEHAILIAIGVVFWWPVFGRQPAGLPTVKAIAYLFLAFVSSGFLGLAFTFSVSAFYSYYEHAPRLLGLKPSADQNLGGVLMSVEQLVVLTAALGWFLLRLLGEDADRQERALAPDE